MLKATFIYSFHLGVAAGVTNQRTSCESWLLPSIGFLEVKLRSSDCDTFYLEWTALTTAQVTLGK